MNKNNISKLKLLLSTIPNRFKENENFFIDLIVVFKSGLKSFKGRFYEENQKTIFSFKGVKKEISISEAIDEIISDAINYDSMIIEYNERGNKLIITSDNKDVKMSTKALSSDLEKEIKGSPSDKNHLNTKTSTLLDRNYFVNHIKAESLLKELNILTKDGKIRNDRIRKYNQIDHYIEILDKDLDKFKGKSINIVDCGCGKSYLSFVLNYYLTEVRKIKCHFTGIDISEKVIEASRKTAQNLGYKNMEFIAADIRDLKMKKTPDIVLSPHACDIATDLALSFAIKNNAELIVAVPCCHGEMNRKFSYSPFDAILKHGIFKRRMADVLTDGVRTLLLESEGYKVSVFEYISPLETPKNIMIKAYRTGRKSEKSLEEFMDLMMQFNYAPALYRYLNDLDTDSLKLYCDEIDEEEDF